MSRGHSARRARIEIAVSHENPATTETRWNNPPYATRRRTWPNAALARTKVMDMTAAVIPEYHAHPRARSRMHARANKTCAVGSPRKVGAENASCSAPLRV